MCQIVWDKFIDLMAVGHLFIEFRRIHTILTEQMDKTIGKSNKQFCVAKIDFVKIPNTITKNNPLKFLRYQSYESISKLITRSFVRHTHTQAIIITSELNWLGLKQVSTRKETLPGKREKISISARWQAMKRSKINSYKNNEKEERNER